MTSTNMFQGLDSSGKPSSRVLRPPGGGSSNLFGGYEEDTSASRRPNKMSSSIFAPPEETRGGPRRSNPPGERAADTLTLSEALCVCYRVTKSNIKTSTSVTNQSVNSVRSYTD
uniref:Uncharacterized protein n=1 Tax=Cyprinus carpio TaxID=7962 RepID=A0A8C1LV66_CYPCA